VSERVARARRWRRITRRGVPPKSSWCTLFHCLEQDLLRDVARERGLSAVDLARALVIHRARVRLERDEGPVIREFCPIAKP
jgi:hypothetical protein